jgi:hypothetical protein
VNVDPRFDAFISSVASRVRTGKRAYGNRSFARPPTALASEIMEELEDVTGWAFILWCRIATLDKLLRKRDRDNGEEF